MPNSCCAISAEVSWKFIPKVPTKNDHHQHQQDVAAAPSRRPVPSRIWCLAAAGRRARFEPAAVDDHQGGDEGQVGDGVGQDRPAGAEGGDHQTGDRRADDAGGVEGGGVETDRVRQLVRDRRPRRRTPGGTGCRRRCRDRRRRRSRTRCGVVATPGDGQHAEHVAAQMANQAWVILSTTPLVEAVGDQPAVRATAAASAGTAAPVVMPIATPEPPDSSSTSQSWATRCIQVPMLETKEPVT